MGETTTKVATVDFLTLARFLTHFAHFLTLFRSTLVRTWTHKLCLVNQLMVNNRAHQPLLENGLESKEDNLVVVTAARLEIGIDLRRPRRVEGVVTQLVAICQEDQVVFHRFRLLVSLSLSLPATYV